MKFLKGHSKKFNKCLDKSVRPGRLICSLKTPRRWPDLSGSQRELDLRVVELFGIHTLAQRHRDGSSLDDLDAGEAHPMTGSHLVIHLLHCSIKCKITVLLVHIVVAGSALISHPDPVVLDGGWILLKDLNRETDILNIRNWTLRLK